MSGGARAALGRRARLGGHRAAHGAAGAAAGAYNLGSRVGDVRWRVRCPGKNVPAWMATALLMVLPALQLVRMHGARCLGQLAWPDQVER